MEDFPFYRSIYNTYTSVDVSSGSRRPLVKGLSFDRTNFSHEASLRSSSDVLLLGKEPKEFINGSQAATLLRKARKANYMRKLSVIYGDHKWLPKDFFTSEFSCFFSQELSRLVSRWKYFASGKRENIPGAVKVCVTCRKVVHFVKEDIEIGHFLWHASSLKSPEHRSGISRIPVEQLRTSRHRRIADSRTHSIHKTFFLRLGASSGERAGVPNCANTKKFVRLELSADFWAFRDNLPVRINRHCWRRYECPGVSSVRARFDLTIELHYQSLSSML